MKVAHGVPLAQGTSPLMKHVHRWQLSHRRHDNEQPNAKGRAVFSSVSIRMHLYSRADPGLSPFLPEFKWEPSFRLNSSASREILVTYLPAHIYATHTTRETWKRPVGKARSPGQVKGKVNNAVSLTVFDSNNFSPEFRAPAIVKYISETTHTLDVLRPTRLRPLRSLVPYHLIYFANGGNSDRHARIFSRNNVGRNFIVPM